LADDRRGTPQNVTRVYWEHSGAVNLSPNAVLKIRIPLDEEYISMEESSPRNVLGDFETSLLAWEREVA
jgi:hypothetical protein